MYNMTLSAADGVRACVRACLRVCVRASDQSPPEIRPLPIPPVLIEHHYFKPRRIRDVEWTQLFIVRYLLPTATKLASV